MHTTVVVVVELGILNDWVSHFEPNKEKIRLAIINQNENAYICDIWKIIAKVI